MIIIRASEDWSPSAYNGQLPPPLCFTDPAGNARAEGLIQQSGSFAVSPRKPKLMMDPYDRTTWQRPYRWS